MRNLAATAAMAALIAGAAPAMVSAQDARPAGADEPVTLQGVVVTSEWGGEEVWIHIRDTESQRWRVRAPDTRTMLAMKLSANVLEQDAPITVTGRRIEGQPCDRGCAIDGEEVVIGDPPARYELHAG